MQPLALLRLTDHIGSTTWVFPHAQLEGRPPAGAAYYHACLYFYACLNRTEHKGWLWFVQVHRKLLAGHAHFIL